MGNDIVLDDNFVSRYHAQLIIYDNGLVAIKDLGSSNGTFVNGNRITERNLEKGDIVKCGEAFFNWLQYVEPQMHQANEMGYSGSAGLGSTPVEPGIQTPKIFTLGEVFNYLTVRIFDVGDLFKFDWETKTPVLFFAGVPLGILLAILMYIYSIIPSFASSFSKIVLIPLVCGFILFGVAQFITMALFSSGRNVGFKRLSLASSIFGFMQFLPLLVYGIIMYSTLKNSLFGGYPGSYYDRHSSSDSYVGYFIMLLFEAVIFLRYTLQVYVYLYKYFRTIGISKGNSLNFVVLSILFNLLLQVGFGYFVITNLHINSFF